MTILDRFVRSAVGRVQSRAQTVGGTIKSNLAGKAAGATTGLISRATDYQSALFEKALTAVNAGAVLDSTAGKALGNIGQQLGLKDGGLAKALDRQKSGRLGALGPAQPERVSGTAASSRGGPGGGLNPSPTARPAQPGPAGWTPAPGFGTMSLNTYRQLWLDSAQVQKAWKNLWYIEITDFEATEEGANSDLLNVLALDVSFGPYTIASEPVPIGAAVMDSVTGTERVELRLTTLDDISGSIKRWVRQKMGQIAATDGTFKVPKAYLVNVKITHMDPGNEFGKDDRFRHRWIMRLTSMECELSRRSAELEELQISLTEFDTFYPRGPNAAR